MPPASLSDFEQQLASTHTTLSRRLREVADYVMKNPQSIALDTAAEIARKADVHGSTLIRFANHFDFRGFSELQKLYKAQAHQHYSDYGERIRANQPIPGGDAESPAALLSEFSTANQHALELLRSNTDPVLLNKAVQILDQAAVIHVCGMRRAFPVSMYFAYALGHMQLQCQAVDGLGLMHEEQAARIHSNHALIAITYTPYSVTTQNIIASASSAGAKVILITGDNQCPSAALANVTFVVQDAEVRSFRSLTSSICLAQTLCIALGYRRESRN